MAVGSSGSLTGDLVPSESHAHANKMAERSARQHSYASGREVGTIRGTINSKSLTSARLQGIQKPLLLAGQGGSADDEGIRCATHHGCQSSRRYVRRVTDEDETSSHTQGWVGGQCCRRLHSGRHSQTDRNHYDQTRSNCHL